MFATATRTFTRANGAAGIMSREPLTADRLRAVAPSVFADDRHSSRSDRYTYIPTSMIVDYLKTAGFDVYSAMQSGSRADDKRGHTKHLLRFRQTGQSLTVGGSHPEIVLVNSHDGSSSYRLMAGLFRLVCSNGLVVSQSVVDDVRLPHKGNILRDVGEGVQRITAQLPTIAESVRAMESIPLTPDEQGIFARAALSVKYGEEPPITETQALTVRRSDDAGSSLWSTMNRVQESLIRGGNRYRIETDRGVQRRTTSPVNSVDGQTRINRAVWQLAEEMRRLKS